MRHQQCRQLRAFQTYADPIAGDTRLADLEGCAADPEPVADTNLVVREPVDREILAEIAVGKVRPTQIFAPVTVGIELIDQNGPLLTAMTGKIALPVPSQIQPCGKHPARRGLLPDRRPDGLPPPCDFPRQSDIDGDENVHTHLLRQGSPSCIGTRGTSICRCRHAAIGGAPSIARMSEKSSC